MINNIFLLSHQDDEMGVFNHIENIVKKRENIVIFYLTNGSIKKRIDKDFIFNRDLESIKVLNKLGVSEDKIVFLGRKLEINVYKLHENLQKTYKYLNDFIKNLNGESNIFTHSNEGGNTDHDSCFYLVKKLINNSSNIKTCYQFSLYNNYNLPFYFYSVMKPLKKNGNIIKSKINFFQKIKYSILLFKYTSQIHIWIGLFPMVIFRIFMNQYGSLQLIDNSLNIDKPYNNLLWYEKRKFITFDKFKKIIELFFQEK
tara:strand:+ start:5115 stop:5885 length:771 start_codon:yes stop_codon:yes gene_type:complete